MPMYVMVLCVSTYAHAHIYVTSCTGTLFQG